MAAADNTRAAARNVSLHLEKGGARLYGTFFWTRQKSAFLLELRPGPIREISDCRGMLRRGRSAAHRRQRCTPTSPTATISAVQSPQLIHCAEG